MHATTTFARAALLLVMLGLAGCATTYRGVTEGPASFVRVTQTGADGLLADLTLYIAATEQSLGWVAIKNENPISIPADELLLLTLSYRNTVVFGPQLSGSKAFALTPEAGVTYVMSFWTDNKQYRVEIFREDPDGQLIPLQIPSTSPAT